MTRKLILLAAFVAAMAIIASCQAEKAGKAETTSAQTDPYTRTFQRIEPPTEFPPHPRVFLNQAEINALKAWIARDDKLREYVDAFIAEMVEKADAPELPDESKSRNPHLARQANKFALAYVLSDEQKLADAAAAILKAYVKVFPGYSIASFKGKATDSTLGEVQWAASACAAYDLIYNSGALTDADKAAIETQVLKESAEVMRICNHAYRSNWRIAATGGVGVVGFTIGDRGLLEEALNGHRDEAGRLVRDGFVQQMAWSMLADGVYYERSLGYTSICMLFYHWFLEAARHSGVDLWHAEFEGLDHDAGVDTDRRREQRGTKSFRSYLDAMCHRTFGDGSTAKVGNDGGGRLSRSTYWAAAWRAYGDPKFASMFRRGLESQVGDPLELMFVSPEMPAGEFDLSVDARIGLNGTHTNACTLLPSGGFAILRQSEEKNAAAVAITFGEYANAHSHPDQLSVVVYANGRTMTPDMKDHSYGHEGHGQWAKHTIAHNTVTVDEVSQYPQGDSEDVWVGDTKERPAFGRLVFFHPGEQLRAVRAETDSVYPSVKLDRTVVMVDSVVVDFFRCTSAHEHQYDYALHIDGEPADGSVEFGEVEDAPPSQRLGYRHLIDVRRAALDGPSAQLAFANAEGGQQLRLALLGGPAELIAAKGYPNKADHRNSALIVRRTGTDVDFVSVMGFGEKLLAGRLDDLPEGLLGVEITREDGSNDIILSAKTVGTFEVAGVTFTGRLALLRTGPDGSTKLIDAVE